MKTFFISSVFLCALCGELLSAPLKVGDTASGQTHNLLPHPAVYVFGSDGIIRFAHVNEDYKVRLEPDKILEAVKAR